MNELVVKVLEFHLAAYLAANLTTDHSFHGFIQLDLATAERPDFKRPFICTTLPGGQVGQANYPKPNTFQQPYRDLTDVTIYVESRLTVDVGSQIRSGHEVEHLPAVQVVRDFIARNRSMGIPVALQADLGTGKIAMKKKTPPEAKLQLRDGERNVFYVQLSYFTTTFDDQETS